MRRRSTASPPIRSAQLLQLLQLLLSVFYSHSPRADCAPHQQDTCSCKQCENLVAPLSGGAALEEAAAWEAKQMENARHAKEPLLAEVERLSAARAKGKKGKKKKKNVGVGDTGAAGLNEEMLSCS